MCSIEMMNIIIVLGTAVILPIAVIFLSLRSKQASEKNKKEIILAALEKNAGIDIEELVKKMNTPEKLLKEKLLGKLLAGLITSFIGVGLLAIFVYVEYLYSSPDDVYILGIASVILLAVGIAFIISYFVGKKMLAREIEAEERNVRQA